MATAPMASGLTLGAKVAAVPVVPQRIDAATTERAPPSWAFWWFAVLFTGHQAVARRWSGLPAAACRYPQGRPWPWPPQAGTPDARRFPERARPCPAAIRPRGWQGGPAPPPCGAARRPCRDHRREVRPRR